MEKTLLEKAKANACLQIINTDLMETDPLAWEQLVEVTLTTLLQTSLQEERARFLQKICTRKGIHTCRAGSIHATELQKTLLSDALQATNPQGE